MKFSLAKIPSGRSEIRDGARSTLHMTSYLGSIGLTRGPTASRQLKTCLKSGVESVEEATVGK